MAYIAPNTTIYVCKGIPCDSNYTYTLHFDSESQQLQYFMSKVYLTFSSLTYQRTERNTCKVEANYYDLIGCDYMFFQNTNYGEKYFYAFIKRIRYINDNTVEIDYSIDVIQTWQHIWQIKKCTVIRNHTVTDYIGDNITNENFNIGDYVINSEERLTDYNELSVAMMLYWKTALIDNVSKLNGAPNAAWVTIYPANASRIKEVIQSFGIALNLVGILDMWMIPQAFLGGDYDEVNINDTEMSATAANSKDVTLSGITGESTLDGYTPNNCKLYTYPYSVLNLHNGKGENLNLRYEFFSDPANLSFRLREQAYPCEALIVPNSYSMNSSGSFVRSINLRQGLTLSGWQKCITEETNVGNNFIGNAVKGITSLAGLYFTGGLTNATGATVAASSLLGQSKELYGDNRWRKVDLQDTENFSKYTALKASGEKRNVKIPPEAVANPSLSNDAKYTLTEIAGSFTQGLLGSQSNMCGSNSGSIFASSHYLNFNAQRLSVTAEIARIIDGYFDRYGYSINEFTTPNLKAREYWTYIQTSDFECRGAIPQEDKELIQGVFDNGILFWNGEHADEALNFSLDNRATNRGVNAKSNIEGDDTSGVIFIWPLPNPFTESYITSYFGYRETDVGSTYHEGIDIGATSGTSIYAVADGIVYSTGYDDTRGNYTVLYHSQYKLYTSYFHQNQTPPVTSGGVSQGDTIGFVGTTGVSTGNHLHFAISTEPFTGYVDPMLYY